MGAFIRRGRCGHTRKSATVSTGGGSRSTNRPRKGAQDEARRSRSHLPTGSGPVEAQVTLSYQFEWIKLARKLSSRSVVCLMVVNGIFWALFGIDFAFRMVPHQRQDPGFDDAVPEYIWFGRAIPYYDDVKSVPYQTMKRIQQPAYAIVQGASRVAVKFGFPYRWGDETIFGISLGGYQILATMFLSFAQWYFIGRLIRRLFGLR